MTAIPADNTTLAILLNYIDCGFSIVPIWGINDGHCACPAGEKCDRSPGKHPNYELAPNGVNSASRDKAIVAEWFRRFPSGNWAVRSGMPLSDGKFLVCVDVDPRNGGIDSFARLQEKFGLIGDTWAQDSGGNGAHYLFWTESCPGSWSDPKEYPGIDIIGDRKYFLVYPSRHITGGLYSWALGQSPDDLTIASAPPWAVRNTDGSARPVRNVQGVSARATVMGELFRLAGTVGVDLDDGSVGVKCPWHNEHSDARGHGYDSSTVIFPPAGGSNFGGWKCMHSHCAHRNWQDVFSHFPKDWVERARAKYPMTVVRDDYMGPEDGATAEDTDETTAIFKKKLADCQTRVLFDNKGNIRKTVINVISILSYDPRWENLLEYDSFRHSIKFKRPPQWHADDIPAAPFTEWTEDATNCLDTWLQRYYGLDVGIEKIVQGVSIVAKRDSVNPLVEYLDSLEWDETPRLNRWLHDYLGAKNDEYTRVVGRKWMISAVARAYQPGCQADHAIILEGGQGWGKSTALKILASTPWFADTHINIGDKDAYLSLRGKWIVELAELASLKRADLDKAKNFFTSRVDTYRPPYGRIPADFPRQCVFAGTVNPDVNGYLVDPTGNRRYWPVMCGQTIHLGALADDRDQLWAEAVALYKGWVERGSDTNECLWWPSLKEQSLFAGEQEARTQSSPWVEPVYKWLKGERARSLITKNGGFVTAHQVLTEALGFQPKEVDRVTVSKITACMTQLRWTLVPRRGKGTDAVCYCPPVDASSK